MNKFANFILRHFSMAVLVILFFDRGLPLLIYAFADKSKEPYGFIDKGGHMAINLRERDLWSEDSFAQGQCLVSKVNSSELICRSQYFLMNTQGNLVSNVALTESQVYDKRCTLYQADRTFHDGVKAVKNKSRTIINYLDTRDQVYLTVSRANLEKRSFQCNLQNADDDCSIRFYERVFLSGLFDCGGDNLDASEGLVVFQKGDKFGYIALADKSVAIEPTFDYCWPFSDGRALVYVETPLGSRFGYIDHTGKTVIPFKYARAFPFSEGLAVVSKNMRSEEYNYIDTDGKTVFNRTFLYAKSFHNGLARVGRWRTNTDSF